VLKSLHFAGQHPLDHFHGFGVGDAHALDKVPFFAEPAQRGLDLRAAAVHHHRVHAHQFEQHHVLGKIGLQLGIGHGVAAILDHHRLAMEATDIGQRLGQDFGLVTRRNVQQVGHGMKGSTVKSEIVPQAGAGSYRLSQRGTLNRMMLQYAYVYENTNSTMNAISM
jgi:hypothetical protein